MHCTRSPPISRKHRFVQEIIRLAEDDSYGYSQRPPSGRWGPDYDCTSLIYQAAHNVGYNAMVDEAGYKTDSEQTGVEALIVFDGSNMSNKSTTPVTRKRRKQAIKLYREWDERIANRK